MPKTLFALASLATLLVAGSTAAPLASAESPSAAPASTATAAPGTAAAQSSDVESVVNASIDDIQHFWSEEMPDVYGQDYREIPSDRIYAYSASDPPPACGGRGTTPYQEVAGNAFYCSEGDFIAYDAQELFPRLDRKFGPFAVALVLAHEWGHAIQARTDSTINATIYLETQADCFAGSWVHHVEHDDVSLPIGNTDIDIALAGYLEFRDPPGVDPSRQGAHGNAFDRVSAFQDGFDDGANQCASYENDPPEVTETGFTTQEDYANGGDLPLQDALDLIQPDLDDYWKTELQSSSSPVKDLVASSDESCDGSSDGGVLVDAVTYCASDGVVRYDRSALQDIYDASGDFGAGMVVAAAWSSGALHAEGRSIGSNSAHTTADCLTGSWAGDVAREVRDRGQDGLLLSPGDLDEGIATFVSLGDGNGSAFSRVAAFRKGFFKGADACTA